MSASWPHSRQVISPGALAYIFDTQTLTPRVTFQDASLSTPHQHPIVADSTGRFPRVFLKSGLYRERIVNAAGVVIWDDDNIDAAPVYVPENTGAPEASELIKTGAVIWRTVGGVINGFVRLNGATIGGAASSATERANDDTYALYALLWNGHSNAICPVIGGRGSSAIADFTANKPLTLPDFRWRTMVGASGMGTPPVAINGKVPFQIGSAADGGAKGGQDASGLSIDELPIITPSGSISLSIKDANNFEYVTKDRGGGFYQIGSPGGVWTFINKITLEGSAQFHGNPFGGNQVHNNMPPFLISHAYMKI